MQDGTLLKLVKSGETEFWTKTIHALPSVPDFLPLFYGHGELPARDGVDKAARAFVLMQNVVGVMCVASKTCARCSAAAPSHFFRNQPNVIDIKLGTRSYAPHSFPQSVFVTFCPRYSLHDTQEKQACAAYLLRSALCLQLSS